MTTQEHSNTPPGELFLSPEQIAQHVGNLAGWAAQWIQETKGPRDPYLIGVLPEAIHLVADVSRAIGRMTSRPIALGFATMTNYDATKGQGGHLFKINMDGFPDMRGRDVLFAHCRVMSGETSNMLSHFTRYMGAKRIAHMALLEQPRARKYDPDYSAFSVGSERHLFGYGIPRRGHNSFAAANALYTRPNNA
ncbi:MAG TPA: hypothetical protein VLE73_03900 [Candidatus Saccharimonadales bacterium]|nr:hypothetical protein [Candidatus Saccharimonadales bacterium]